MNAGLDDRANGGKAVRKDYRGRTAYVEGNTVRKLQTTEAYPRRERTFEQSEQVRKQRKAQQRRIHRANKMNFLYTAAVTTVVAVIFVICYQYLNLQTVVKNNAAQVAELEAKLNTLTAENDELDVEISAGIDYDAIYETAVNELGMVYPERSQVIRYEAGESEYVKQYQDIPESK